MNRTVTLAEAKTHISALVTEVANGGEVTITRHGRPVARLVGAPTQTRRAAGDWGWPGEYDPAVFAPMTEQDMRDEGWPV
jgi:prevent-host-death family protein